MYEWRVTRPGLRLTRLRVPRAQCGAIDLAHIARSARGDSTTGGKMQAAGPSDHVKLLVQFGRRAAKNLVAIEAIADILPSA